MDCVTQLRDALQAALGPLDWLPEPDGDIHRVHVPSDKQGTCNGWYLLSAGSPPAGCFGSWRKSGLFTAGTAHFFGWT